MRQLEDLHSIGSLMLTIDHAANYPMPWETDEQFKLRQAQVRDAAESIHRHHVQPLIDRIRLLERERFTNGRQNRIDVEWYP